LRGIGWTPIPTKERVVLDSAAPDAMALRHFASAADRLIRDREIVVAARWVRPRS
jgi:hypothetical protein